MTEYYVFGVENIKYKLILDRLCNLSDIFCLVEPIADTRDFPDELPEPKGGAKRSIVKSYGTIATNN